MPKTASGKRMAVYYAFLALAVTMVTIFVVQRGRGQEGPAVDRRRLRRRSPQSPVSARRRRRRPASRFPSTPRRRRRPPGPSFDVKQSGQFVNLSNTQGTLGGKLRLKENARAAVAPAHR